MIETYLTDRCEVTEPGAKNQWSSVTATLSRTIPCLFSDRSSLVRNERGEEVLSSGRFSLPADVEITTGHRIVHSGKTYVPIRVSRPKTLGSFVTTTVDVV